ncbi:MAG: hypothetical protein IRZ32_07275 [Solirubrobacteraceae bacterium]|nr:hypothetical protein [Solirubrobacteraceae bacterium]
MPSAPLDPHRPSGRVVPAAERHLRVLRRAAKAARARLRAGEAAGSADGDLAARAERTERRLRDAEARAGEARAEVLRRGDAEARGNS